MRPLVTIVTPSFNQGRFLGHTIDSVRAQAGADIEHLVFDAGSTDESAAILARHANRLQAVIGADRGQADAINRGLQRARGEIVGWLNSDDVLLPGAVAAAVDYLLAHPQHAMVYGDAHYIDAGGKFIGRYPTAPIAYLPEGCVICQPATFMWRRAVTTLGYLDDSLRYCMDYDLWLRFAACFSIGYLPRLLACSRLHPAAKTVADRLAFHREVVEMTRRRLGATPLPWLYGYADLLAATRVSSAPVRRVLAIALTVGLLFRYHPRVSRDDVRLLGRRLRAGTAAAAAGSR